MFSKRIEGMGTSIFTVMSKLSVEHDAVNLGQGFPDFDGPAWLFDEAYKIMKDGKNQYAQMPGIYSLRKILSEVYRKRYSLDFEPDTDICITAGATEALFSSINALINPGDEVIMFEPVYDSYLGDVQLAGGVAKYVTLRRPDFKFDFDELEETITDRTRLIILNNPHNPSGKVYTEDELKFISELVIEHDLFVISDEVYEYITFDEAKHIPVSTLPGMAERTITISSAGKTFSVTGWKIGWACGNSKLIDAVKKVHQWTTFAVNTPGQHAITYAFSRLDEYLPEFKKMYLNKRNLMLTKLEAGKFSPHVPKGSYFMMVDIPETKLNDEEIATMLVKEYGVATIPPSVFYGKSGEGRRMLRLCFAKADETIIKGINNLNKFKA